MTDCGVTKHQDRQWQDPAIIHQDNASSHVTGLTTAIDFLGFELTALT